MDHCACWQSACINDIIATVPTPSNSIQHNRHVFSQRHVLSARYRCLRTAVQAGCSFSARYRGRCLEPGNKQARLPTPGKNGPDMPHMAMWTMYTAKEAVRRSVSVMATTLITRYNFQWA